MQLDNFFIDGYVLLEESNLHEKTDMLQYLEEKYLSILFPKWKLIGCEYSESVLPEDRITFWHNDSKFGMNVTFLYYIDEMSPEVGGSISIRNGFDEIKIYPKSGTLILMSQKPNMQHKAEYCSILRRMYNIDYYIDGY